MSARLSLANVQRVRRTPAALEPLPGPVDASAPEVGHLVGTNIAGQADETDLNAPSDFFSRHCQFAQSPRAVRGV